MKRLQPHHILLAGLLVWAGLGNGCASTNNPEPELITVPWTEALTLLPTGEVDWVMQYHNRLITLMMKDGRSIWTKAPEIDVIFDVLEECGEPCQDIGAMTQ